MAEEHLDGAGALLAAAHEAHRAADPRLAEANARSAVEEAWRRDGAVLGYLVGREAENRY